MKAILIALGLTLVIALFSQQVFHFRLPGWMVLVLYFSFYALFLWMYSSQKILKTQHRHPAEEMNWPLSGPLQKLGKSFGSVLFLSIFTATQLAYCLNPWLLVQIIRQKLGNDYLKKQEKESGTDFSNYEVKASYALPFAGEWLVYNGGNTPETSHSWDILVQRFAMDCVVADSAYSRHSQKGSHLEDYYCYGKDILAAADGTVVSMEDRIKDAPFVGFGFSDFTARSFFGNTVILQHSENEYGVYAHLIKGSIPVKPGQHVKQGEIIGRCGHSGNSTEPHLHFHLQNSPDLYRGMGLPIRFENLIINGEDQQSAFLQAGQRVQNSDKT